MKKTNDSLINRTARLLRLFAAVALLPALAYAQSPNPRRLGIFVETTDKTKEVTTYGEEVSLGVAPGYRLPLDELGGGVPGVRHVFVNMPGIDVMNTKLCWQRVILEDGVVFTSNLFEVPAKVEHVSGSLYRLDADAFRHTKDGYYFVRVRMPAGSRDRLYVIPLQTAPPREAKNDREAAIQTLARIRTLDAVWNCLMTVADLKNGYDFEAARNPTHHAISVQSLRSAGHDQGCWNVASRDIPTLDGWNRPFQLSVWGGTRLDERSRGFEIRSAGRDGIFEHATSGSKVDAANYDADIVWVRSGTYAGEGTFIQIPKGVPLPVCPQSGDCLEPRSNR